MLNLINNENIIIEYWNTFHFHLFGWKLESAIKRYFIVKNGWTDVFSSFSSLLYSYGESYGNFFLYFLINPIGKAYYGYELLV